MSFKLSEVCQKYPELQPAAFKSGGEHQHLSVRPATPVKDEEAANLYRALHYLLTDRFSQTGIPTNRADFSVNEDANRHLGRGALALVAVLGRLVAEGFLDPHDGRGRDFQPGDLRTPDNLLIGPRFAAAAVNAFNWYMANAELVEASFRLVAERGVSDIPKPGLDPKPIAVIRPQQLVNVVESLARAGIAAGDPLLDLHVSNALSMVAGSSGGDVVNRASSVPIDILALEDQAAPTILRDNIVPLSFLYQAAILEELKVPQVVDRILAHWVEGTIPVTLGAGPDLLYRFYRTSHERMTETERRSVFARAFGMAQGSVEIDLPNREFHDLFMRFVASVSAYSREATDSYALRRTVLPEQVFKAGRDLGANLSLHGYGMPHFAAAELQESYRTMFKILGNNDILQAFGVRDSWQAVERISAMSLGGAVNGVKLRTLAQSGAAIIRWIAESAPALSAPSAGDSFKKSLESQPIPGVPGPATSLIMECERWLAVTGTNDQTVTQFSEPVSLTSQSTVPMLSLGATQAAQQVQQMVRSFAPNGILPTA